MITVYFPKYLRSLTNGIESQKFDTTDAVTLISGIRTLFPQLSLYITHMESGQNNNLCFLIDKNTKTRINNSLSNKLIATDIVFIISIYGQGDDFTGILIGAALIAASFIPGLQGVTVLGLSVTSALLTAGISLTLSGVMSLFRPGAQSSSTPSDNPVRANNESFGPLQNTTSTDTAIPLIFGQMRVSGQFIGGRVKSIKHNAGDVINLANYV